ncbi:MAG: EcsC family protein [Floccifex porci]|uniref:EcsC family protein n=1 Tax=Floccifex porci TaxID=2606629 RepID=UPI0023F01D6A|nr:EcsC family protein [Floccifex porci]MCI7803250.1 EcsC family protein [Erysipelotrichaceae bacterium]MDD7467699.1 EcsC family protein [Floccifex porci]MDY4797228.1 EcsC family protein [Floccifex porci]
MNSEKKKIISTGSNLIKTAKEKAVPFVKKTIDETKEFTTQKIIPEAKNFVDETKNTVSKASKKVEEKIQVNLTEQQMMEILNTLYIKSIDGIPKVSLPIDDLVKDYLDKNEDVEKAAESLINNSIVKCGTSGFLTSFGGFATLIAALPANITSVIYVQLRMCCAIAKMAGYDIYSDQVQTFIFVCLTGSAMTDILKQAGVKFGEKLGISMIKKIPGKTLTAINKKVGFRFVTKFGEKGIVNLGKVIPVVGGVVGGGFDIASTSVIGKNAYSIFMKGEMPSKEEIERDLPIDVEVDNVSEI